jgi:hypothetical protein
MKMPDIWSFFVRFIVMNQIVNPLILPTEVVRFLMVKGRSMREGGNETRSSNLRLTSPPGKDWVWLFSLMTGNLRGQAF